MPPSACSLEGPTADISGRATPVTESREIIQPSPSEGRDVHEDPDIDRVAHALASKDPRGVKIAKVLRSAIDVLLDGQRTGRYDFDQLPEAEKSRLPDLVVMGLRRDLKLGSSIDPLLEISGANLTCHLSREPWNWLFAVQDEGSLALLLSANDRRSVWYAGLVHTGSDKLSRAANRDGKRMISRGARKSVHQLFWGAPLEETHCCICPKAM